MSDTLLAEGKWHHVVCIRSGGIERVFINNVEAATGDEHSGRECRPKGGKD